MSIKQNLKEIINQAKLSEQDEGLWSKFIEVNNEGVVNDIYEVLKDDLGSVGFFTKNLRDKMDAFVDKDSEKLNKIVDEEVEMIKNL